MTLGLFFGTGPLLTVGPARVKDGTPSDDAVPWGFANPVVDHAAHGDGTTDDTAALQDACASGTPLWLAAGERYRITDTVALATAADLLAHGAVVIFDHAANDRSAFVAGTHTDAVAAPGWRVEGLRVHNRRQSDWSNRANIGVLSYNVRVPRLEITEVRGFTTGFQGLSLSRGDRWDPWAYAWIGLGEIWNCQVAIEIDNRAAPGVEARDHPWTNQNLFIGGRFAVEDGINRGHERLGIVMHSSDGSWPSFNALDFLGPVFELNAADAEGRSVNVHAQGAYCGIWNAAEESGATYLPDGTGDLLWRFDSNGSGDIGSMHEVSYGYTPDRIAALGERVYAWIRPPHRPDGGGMIDRRGMMDGTRASSLQALGAHLA